MWQGQPDYDRTVPGTPCGRLRACVTCILLVYDCLATQNICFPPLPLQGIRVIVVMYRTVHTVPMLGVASSPHRRAHFELQRYHLLHSSWLIRGS
eukprot:2582748-Prymnesium_polylepis.2